ncbi:MAG: hypothetical protein CMB82_07045 [Flammeovirgaceae bacterium]|nr:hypothetical protein [Flammeovirgaceae bacterium]
MSTSDKHNERIASIKKNMKRYLNLLAIVLVNFICTIYANGQEIKGLNLEGLEDKIESLVPNAVKDSTPGLVIGIFQNEELIFSKGYGMANLSYNISNSPEMLYNLGSVSKQFLGYAFAILQSEGKVNIDDPVGEYLDNWPEFNQKVTIRHLLSHTSGYREAYSMSELAGRTIGIDRLTRDECLEVVRRQAKLEFAPGSRFTYNSTAWVILAEILERVTEQSAHAWVTENVLVPMGMKTAHIESFVGEVIPNAAESYYFEKGLGYGAPKSNRAIFGAADVYASINDIFHWFSNFQTQKVGNESVMDIFLSPYELNDGTSTQYGFGIRNSMHKGLKLYSHTGAHESFLTQLRYYPENNFGIIAISNFEGNGWIATNQIAEYVLAEYMTFFEKIKHKAFDISMEQIKQLEGTYLSPYRNEVTNLAIINDTLTIWGGMQIIPISENRFYSKSWGGEFEFIKKEGHSTQLIIAYEPVWAIGTGVTESKYQKVDEWTPSLKDLKKYESSYRSKELETNYTIILKGNQLAIQHRWLGEIGLTPITDDMFRSDQDWFVEFRRSKTNEIIGFNINSNRTLNVFFEKNK